MVRRRAVTPDVYERDFHLPAGHATSFASGPLAAFRNPNPELTGYETAVGGLYLTGAATFPGAGVWGASGRNGGQIIGGIGHDPERDVALLRLSRSLSLLTDSGRVEIQTLNSKIRTRFLAIPSPISPKSG